jgi:hypothetical protein
MSLVVRANSSPELLGDAVRQAVRRIDPSLAVADVQLMNQIADASVATPRLRMCWVWFSDKPQSWFLTGTAIGVILALIMGAS